MAPSFAYTFPQFIKISDILSFTFLQSNIWISLFHLVSLPQIFTYTSILLLHIYIKYTTILYKLLLWSLSTIFIYTCITLQYCIRKCETMKMKVEVVEHKRGVVEHINGKVSKKKRVRKLISSSTSTANMRMENELISISLPLQQVYSYCKTIFKGPGIVPPPQDVHNFCNLLDTLIPEDFGLNEKLPFFKRNCVIGNPRVTYTTVYKCQKFSLVLFFLPAGAVIPLHNHPLMTVFSKLLLGKMHIKAYDWAESEDVCSKQPLSSKLARLKVNSTFTAPCNSSVLFPTSGGNIHEFTAITPCAVLDVLGPPYSKEDGRDSSYYKEILFPLSDEKVSDLKDDKQSYGLLEEIEMPENAKMDGIMYLGPQIIENAD